MAYQFRQISDITNVASLFVSGCAKVPAAIAPTACPVHAAITHSLNMFLSAVINLKSERTMHIYDLQVNSLPL